MDLGQSESFGFLGFDFRRIRSRRGVWRANYTPKIKKRTALLRAEPFSRVLRLKSDRSALLFRRADVARFGAQRLAGEQWRFGRQVLCLGELGEGAARPH